MKKRIVIALVIVLSLAMMSGTALASLVKFTGNCNVRSSPSLNATSIGVVGPSTSLDYLYQDSTDYRGVTWYKVNYGGSSGWVSSMYSYIDDGFMWVQVYGNSHVRSAPNLNGRSLGVALRGDSLDYLGYSSWDERGVRWYKVQFYAMEGWISSAYTELFP